MAPEELGMVERMLDKMLLPLGVAETEPVVLAAPEDPDPEMLPDTSEELEAPDVALASLTVDDPLMEMTVLFPSEDVITTLETPDAEEEAPLETLEPDTLEPDTLVTLDTADEDDSELEGVGVGVGLGVEEVDGKSEAW